MSILFKGNLEEGNYTLIKSTDGWVLKGETSYVGFNFADRKTENSSEKPNNCKDEPQTYITEDRTQMLDRWQTHHRNTTSAVTPCSNCQEFDCYGCEYKQTGRNK